MTHVTAKITAIATAILVSRAAAADPARSVVETTTYNHAPLTLWLAPQIGTGGLSSGKVRTNLALSLGVSGYARLDGLDLGVGGSWITEDMRGAQVTVGMNRAGGDAIGAQITAGANIAERLRGVQIAAGVNVARVDAMGLQLSSGVNYGAAVEGAQIGLVNVGGQVSGAQIGLVNVATGVRGAQIGLVNVADDASASVGLLNVIEHGRHHVDLWSSDVAPLNVSLKLGGEHVYSVLALGVQESDGQQRWLAGLGIGGHVPIGDRFFLEPELIGWHVNEGSTITTETNELTSLRLLGGYRVRRQLAFFAGPTLNLLVTRVGDGEGFGLIRGTRLSSEGSERTVRAWPGFVAGFQI